MNAMPDKNDVDPRQRKEDRIAVRLSPSAKRTLEQAARMSGRSLSDFVIGSALGAAQETIDRQYRMRLAAKDRAAFVAAMSRPPKASRRLRSAAARHKALTK